MYEALTRPQLIAGCERSALFGLVMLCGGILYFGGFTAGEPGVVVADVIVFVAGKAVLGKAAQHDPQLREVVLRSLRRPKYLEAVALVEGESR